MSAAAPSRQTILVVEDDADGREAFLDVLENEGYHVVGSADCWEALAHLRASPVPALILLDLMLPEMSGPEFVAILRGNPSHATIPIIVCSASTRAREEAAAIGAVACLTKPVSVAELVAAVRLCAAP